MVTLPRFKYHSRSSFRLCNSSKRVVEYMNPEITVSICTYRRYDYLTMCLESLGKQTLPKERFTVVIVDNSLSPEESKQFQDNLNVSFSLKYIITEKSGLSFARNVALENCATPLIAYIDDDAQADPNWLENIVGTFLNHGSVVGVVGGRVEPVFNHELPDWFNSRLQRTFFRLDWGQSEERIFMHWYGNLKATGRWLVGANIAYRTDVLHSVGGFPEYLGRIENLLLCDEELAVNDKISRRGYEVIYTPFAKVDHHVQTERISRRWINESAFWSGISKVLMFSKKDLNRKLLIEKAPDILKLLQLMLKQYEKSDSVDPDEILNTMRRLRDQGIKTINNLGIHHFDSSSLPWPVMYCILSVKGTESHLKKILTTLTNSRRDFSLRLHILDVSQPHLKSDLISEWIRENEHHERYNQRGTTLLTISEAASAESLETLGNTFSKMTIHPDAVMIIVEDTINDLGSALLDTYKLFCTNELLKYHLSSGYTALRKSFWDQSISKIGNTKNVEIDSLLEVLPTLSSDSSKNTKVDKQEKVVTTMRTWRGKLKQYFIYLKHKGTIKKSGLFFSSYYLKNNTDVKNAGSNPLRHYCLSGYLEGRNPNPLFNSNWYRNTYPDVKTTEINPLLHYILYGWKEGRNPGPDFSTSFYLKTYPDVRKQGINPLKHYLLHGITEGRLAHS